MEKTNSRGIEISYELMEAFWPRLFSGVKLTQKLSDEVELLREDLHQNLMAGIGLVRENLSINQDLNSIIISNASIMEKVSQGQSIITAKNRSLNNPSPFASWPVQIIREQAFNCVGGSLLGIHFLNSLGVEHYLANPFEHIINIVKLSGQEWLLIDFTNGLCKKFNPEIINFSSQVVLKTSESFADSSLFPIYDQKLAPAFAIGNLQTVINYMKTKQDGRTDEFIENRFSEYLKHANEIIESFSRELIDFNWAVLRDLLGKEHINFREFVESNAEAQKIFELEASLVRSKR